MGLFGKRLKGNPPSGNRVRILFATDLHGSEYTFAKLLKGLKLWRPDVLVLGGDVAGKGLLPVLVTKDRARFRWMGEEHSLPLAEVGRHEERASQLGLYPYRVDPAGLDRLDQDETWKDQVFQTLMVERWADWLKRLEAHCAEFRLPAYVMAGSDDPWPLIEINAEERQWVKGTDRAVLPLLDHWSLLSLGLINESPLQSSRDDFEAQMAKNLESLADQINDFGSTIANIHMPPRRTALDITPELDTSVDPPRAFACSRVPVGSIAVLEFIKKYQPLLSLHGYVHVSPGKADIGRTCSINPGSEFAEGILRAVLVTLEPERVVGHQFVNG